MTDPVTDIRNDREHDLVVLGATGFVGRLLAAYRHVQTRPVKVIVLGGPRDFFANGIHLNVIEAADDPGAESWRNINAIDDLVQVILTNTGQLTVAALAGNAAAGGLMLALATIGFAVNFWA